MDGALIVAGVTLAAVIFYVAECAIWPWTNCRRCKGTGQHRAWWGVRAWRYCRRCDGSGRRLRAGRQAWNLYRKLKADA
jgi:hypothetical protein